MKRSLPILIALILCVVLCSCKSKDATAADDMILAIGEVTLDSEQDIIQAENAVNALEDKDYKLTYDCCPAVKPGLAQTIQYDRRVLDTLPEQAVNDAGVAAKLCGDMFSAF